jgi:hypothetical protein
MFIVLNAIGVPTADIGLLFAVDWLVDRIRTTNNLLGDLYATIFVEHFSQKELQVMDYHHAPVAADLSPMHLVQVQITTDDNPKKQISNATSNGKVHDGYDII